MGLNTEAFEGIAIKLINKHVPDLGEGAIVSKLSKNGKYLGLTITIHAVSQEQLDNLYRDLTSEPLILWVL